jgi:spore germination cell wall hydrolase CwlJ-like protein
VAVKVLNGDIYLTEVANATHYHATYVRPDWSRYLKKMTKIGLHIFYRFKTATG